MTRAEPEDADESDEYLDSPDAPVNEDAVAQSQPEIMDTAPNLKEHANAQDSAKEFEVEELMHAAPVVCETEAIQAMESGLTETIELPNLNLHEAVIEQSLQETMPIAASSANPAFEAYPDLAVEAAEVIENSTESLNKRFLAALKRATETSDDDKRFGKILAKMEKGKKLKKKESSLVYFLLREQGQCP